jgi:hypothetical protein
MLIDSEKLKKIIRTYSKNSYDLSQTLPDSPMSRNAEAGRYTAYEKVLTIIGQIERNEI